MPTERRSARVGERFGRLTVEAAWIDDARRQTVCLCQCDCGQSKQVLSANLRRGNTRSCGCLIRNAIGDRMRTHGASRTPEYAVWRAIRDRCENPNDPRYKNYGARGIKVCDRWQRSFIDFMADMGPRPSDQHSIDRRKNGGDYEPSNCRWATRNEQAQNTRKSKAPIEFMGQAKHIAEWARELGIRPDTLALRIARGWTLEAALTRPVLPKKPRRKQCQ